MRESGIKQEQKLTRARAEFSLSARLFSRSLCLIGTCNEGRKDAIFAVPEKTVYNLGTNDENLIASCNQECATRISDNDPIELA